MGCIVQVIFVTQSFFAFEVATRLRFEIPKKIPAPAVSACFRYFDILDIDALNEKYDKSFKLPLSVEDIIRIQDFIIMRDIFTLTPQARIDSCFVRNPYDYTYDKFDGQYCTQRVFHMRKFQTQEYICYLFVVDPQYRKHLEQESLSSSEKHEDKMWEGKTNVTLVSHLKRITVRKLPRVTFDKEMLSFAPSYSNVFYYIRLLSNITQFGNSRVIRPAVHSVNEYPYRSLSLAPIVSRIKSQHMKLNGRLSFSGNEDINKLYMHYYIITVSSLPAPYDTRCVYRSQSDCLRWCTTRKIQNQLGKLPFNVITKENADDKQMSSNIVSSYDIRNTTVGNMIKKAEAECILNDCFRITCQQDFTLTHTRSASSPNQEFIQFQVMAPEDLFLYIESLPKMLLNDYLLLVFALIGLWLGVSVHDICSAAKKGMGTIRVENKSQLLKHDMKTDFESRNLLTKKLLHRESKFCHKTRVILEQEASYYLKILTQEFMTFDVL